MENVKYWAFYDAENETYMCADVNGNHFWRKSVDHETVRVTSESLDPLLNGDDVIPPPLFQAQLKSRYIDGFTELYYVLSESRYGSELDHTTVGKVFL